MNVGYIQWIFPSPAAGMALFFLVWFTALVDMAAFCSSDVTAGTWIDGLGDGVFPMFVGGEDGGDDVIGLIAGPDAEA